MMAVDPPDRMRARLARRVLSCAAKWREVAICLLLAYAGAVHAEELVGKVIKVADGDTLTLLTSDKHQRKIKIAQARRSCADVVRDSRAP